jgi:hypothetical protein
MKIKVRHVALNLAAIIGVSLSSTSLAVQPLSEKDMGEVSFESGLNLLNVYGPTSAGLSDDVEVAKPSEEENPNQAIETAASTAKELLEDSESNNEAPVTIDTNADVTFKEFEEAIKASVETVGTAQVFDTTSEIQYRKKDFFHGAEFLDNGDVVHTRELQIDLLKLENLRIDPLENNPSAGNIYLSDWESRGSTTLSVD